MRRKYLSIVFILTAFLNFSQTKKEQVEQVNVSTAKAILLGKTQPVRDLPRTQSTDRNRISEARKRITTAPMNFIGRQGSKVTRPELEHQGIDPLRQKTTFNGRMTSIEPKVNRDGLANPRKTPLDPTGDVGLRYYVQAINATRIAVYDKTDGTLVDEFAANTLWILLNESSSGDPIVLFDHEYNRWIITEFTPSNSANLLFAISETSDPLGRYMVYAFSPPEFPDYPKWSIWSDTYMVTTREGGPGALHQYFFDRAAFIAGDSEVTFQRVEIAGNSNTEAGFYVSTPVSWIGDIRPVDNKPIAVKINDSAWGEITNDAVEVFTFDVDFVNGTTVTKTTIETTPFDGYPCDNTNPSNFSCLSQRGSSQGIDGQPELIMNLPHYRNFETHESIVLSFITDVDDGNNLSGIRWMELRKTTGDWMLHQEGTFAPDDALHRFLPSISLDKDGNIGLAYNVTGVSEFVGIRYTGRYAEDPLGTMTVPEYNVVEGIASVSSTRFGDYAQMGIDPQDGRTFWYTSEYAGPGGHSNTRIVAFQLEENAHDLIVQSIDEPNTSAALSSANTVTANVENIGSQSATDFDLILKLDDSIIETYRYDGILSSGATLKYDFNTTVDLSSLGDYEIIVEVDLFGDEVPSNNILTKVVSKLALNDVSVSVSNANPSATCNETLYVNVRIRNEGETTLESVDIEVYLNASLSEMINWTGSLETGESAVEEVITSGLVSGDNEISIVLGNPNQVSDEILTDNEASLSQSIGSNPDQITLIIITDNYANETHWELLDDEGAVEASGGPYLGSIFHSETITKPICIDSEACYEFKIYDTLHDGICCMYGNGSYSIVDDANNIIFASNGQFGSSESTNFCIGIDCNLTVNVDVIDANNDQLGSIIIEASGGSDYEYSINGGNSLQNSPVFDDLASGSYEVYVLSPNGNCVHEETVDITFDCRLSITITEEKNSDGTGNIEIHASGGDTYEYSIDGGNTFQTPNSFSNLASDTYEIHVMSNGDRCTIMESFEFDFVLGISFEQSVTIAPNPTSEVFKISVPGHDYIDGFLEVNLLDLNGRIIQRHRFNRYEKAFEGMISLYAYPDGIYFLKLVNAKSGRLMKIIKQ